MDVRTQQELAAELQAAGFEVTQATVSRDIRELGLVKVATQQGDYRYALLLEPTAVDALGRAQRPSGNTSWTSPFRSSAGGEDAAGGCPRRGRGD